MLERFCGQCNFCGNRGNFCGNRGDGRTGNAGLRLATNDTGENSAIRLNERQGLEPVGAHLKPIVALNQKLCNKTVIRRMLMTV